MIDIEICLYNNVSKREKIKSKVVKLLKTIAIDEPLWISFNDRYSSDVDYRGKPHLRVFHTNTLRGIATHKSVVMKLREIGLPILVIQLAAFVSDQEDAYLDNDDRILSNLFKGEE